MAKICTSSYGTASSAHGQFAQASSFLKQDARPYSPTYYYPNHSTRKTVAKFHLASVFLSHDPTPRAHGLTPSRARQAPLRGLRGAEQWCTSIKSSTYRMRARRRVELAGDRRP